MSTHIHLIVRVTGTLTKHLRFTVQTTRDKSHGVKIVIPLHTEFYGMKEFAVFDPDGYLLIFAEQVR